MVESGEMEGEVESEVGATRDVARGGPAESAVVDGPRGRGNYDTGEHGN